MIDTVPTIRSLQTPRVDAKSGVEDGSSISNEFVLVQEPHEFVFDTTEANAADQLIQSLLRKLKEPHVESQLSQLLRSDLPEATTQNGQHAPTEKNQQHPRTTITERATARAREQNESNQINGKRNHGRANKLNQKQARGSV